MPAHVNLDALIPREDFEVLGEGTESPRKQSIQIGELQSDGFFYGALRKPDFQRETSEWVPDRVAGLIRAFIQGDLIPAVILWQNREFVFVIDGSHRLGALIAWVQDDYGDGVKSQAFFNHQIPDEQLKIAQRTRKLVEKEFGTYDSHKKAIQNPTAYGPDILSRARRFGSLSITLQWVTGDATTAEGSFFRINQQAATISPQELELIQGRRKPSTIAARAIIRRGTGHQYWSAFAEKERTRVKEIATEIYRLVFDPPLHYPIKSIDLPAGGAVYSATALRMVYDFIGLCVGVESNEDDSQGHRTIEFLERCRRVMQLLLSNHASSLGLHPAVYFYSWTGKQQPILFLTMAELLVELDRESRLSEFIEVRAQFENFLMNNRSLLNQVIRKFGTKASGTKHLKEFYTDTMELIGKGIQHHKLVGALRKEAKYSFLQPEESPYEGVTPTKYSTQVKSGLVMKELLPNAHRCPICGGLVPSQAISVDHKKRREDGGLATVDNAQISHPYCNTGHKESLVAKAKSKAK